MWQKSPLLRHTLHSVPLWVIPKTLRAGGAEDLVAGGGAEVLPLPNKNPTVGAVGLLEGLLTLPPNENPPADAGVLPLPNENPTVGLGVPGIPNDVPMPPLFPPPLVPFW